jgi:ABC-type multidrug transport system ATPase subunit
MVEIQLSNVSKRYAFQWIIKDLNADFTDQHISAIAGNNGSGKSTLIKILSGFLSPSQGVLKYAIDNNKLPVSDIYKRISLVAPYTDLINEFTLEEMLHFHSKFKPFRQQINISDFQEIIQLKVAPDKQLFQYSSGMKQKIQLALAILSDTSILLLDEPTSFLDVNAKKWFSDLLQKNTQNRCVIIASNDSFDLDLCEHALYL